MVLENKSIIFGYLSEFNDYDNSVDDDNIGFQIVEFLKTEVYNALRTNGFYCNAFNPIYITHTNTNTVKVKFILYTTYKADVIISLPENNFTNLHNTINEELKFHMTEKPKQTGGVIR